jgi:hypothetical protein
MWGVRFFACTAEMHWMGLSVPFYISGDEGYMITEVSLAIFIYSSHRAILLAH